MTLRSTLTLLYNHEFPTIVRVLIKQSKTDAFHQGVEIFLGSTDSVVCPVQAIFQYLVVRLAQNRIRFSYLEMAPP